MLYGWIDGRCLGVSAAHLVTNACPDEQLVYLTENRFDLRPEDLTTEQKSFAGTLRREMRWARRHPMLAEARRQAMATQAGRDRVVAALSYSLLSHRNGCIVRNQNRLASPRGVEPLFPA